MRLFDSTTRRANIGNGCSRLEVGCLVFRGPFNNTFKELSCRNDYLKRAQYLETTYLETIVYVLDRRHRLIPSTDQLAFNREQCNRDQDGPDDKMKNGRHVSHR